MATNEECRAALEKMAAKMRSHQGAGEAPELNRTVSCRIPDLGTGFHTQLENGALGDFADGEDASAQITITVNSDDLVALTNGELDFTTAWATDRVRIDASFMDLLKLRTLM